MSVSAKAIVIVLAGSLALAGVAHAAPAATPTPASPAKAAPKFGTAVSECLIQASTETGAAPVVRVKRGTVLKIESVSGAWVKVKTREGLSGFVERKNLVPGNKKVAELPPDPNADIVVEKVPAATPKPGATPTAAVAKATATPEASPAATPVAVAKATAAPVDEPISNRPPMLDGARESRRGLVVRAGPVIATSSYAFTDGDGSSHHTGTRYYGFAADVDYWLLDAFGAHARIASSRGSTSTRVSNSTAVTGIAAELREIQLDLLGRWFVGQSGTAPSVIGGLGFHLQDTVVDGVKVDGASVGPVSEGYAGGVVSLGGNVPLGSPSTGLRANVEYWLVPSLREAGDASGKPKSVSGMGASLGAYTSVTPKIRVEASVEHRAFDARFKGRGVRFGEPVRGAKATDRYTVFVLSGAYRF